MQVGGNFEHPTFAFDQTERLFARAIGDVFAKDNHTRIAFQFGVQTTIDQIDHGARVAAQLHSIFRIKLFRSRIDGGRVDKVQRRFGRRLWTGQSNIRGFVDLAIDFVFQLLQFVLARYPFLHQQGAKPLDWIVFRI